MAVEVEHLAVGRRTKAVRRKAPWSLTPVLSPPPQEPERRWCMQCGREKRPQRRPGPDDGPSTLCNACRYPLKNSASAAAVSSKNTLLLRSNSHRRQGRPSKKRRRSSRENSAPGNNVGGSLDAFFDHTGLEEARKPEQAEKLERLSNKAAFQSVATMAVEVEESPTLGAPRARTKGRRRVTATETTSRQANAPLHGDLRAEKKAVRRCTHCATEKTPQWRVGPEGPGTLCNACGMVFKKGGLLPEYRPVNSPAFSPLLHSNTQRRALKMHRQNGATSACHGEARSELMEGHLLGRASSSPLQRHSPLLQGRLQSKEATSAAGHATAEACCLEECVEVQLLPGRPPVDRPSFALVYHRRVRESGRKSEEAFAVIRATAMDN
uniref:Uncharacterized protein n=1 Tax=Avena sativa TaxID=4498 RepID=A0ACD5V2H0_AVESA